MFSIDENDKISLNDFIQLLKDEVTEIQSKVTIVDDRVPLYALFSDAIQTTIQEIKLGANSQDFGELVIINFIINAAENDYATEEIKKFIENFDDVI